MRTFKKVDRSLIQIFRDIFKDGLNCIFINCDSCLIIDVTDLYKIRKANAQKVSTKAGAALLLEKIIKEKLFCPVNGQVGLIRIEFNETIKTEMIHF